MNWESGVNRCKLLHLEWISNEILLYSTGNYIQSLVMEHDGGLCEKKNMYVYTHTQSFSDNIFRHVPSQVFGYSFQCYTARPHCFSTANAIVCIY